tara:strand:- start:5172 stop:5876 length:705 start_codon:yes stop_codon:yes gene_type:complete
MKKLIIVCAKKTSSQFPNKNLKKINGVSLVAIAIKKALAIGKKNKVIVSTDCKKIKKIALSLGAEVPFIRPSKLSNKYSPEWKVWQHALNYCIKKQNYMPDIFISIPPTSPLGNLKDIKKCIKKYNASKVDGIVTTYKSKVNPYFNMVKFNRKSYLELANKTKKKIFNRQQSPDILSLTTVAYVMNPNFILKKNSLFQGNIKSINIPYSRSIDIDSELDLFIAKKLINYGQKNI